MNYHYEEFDPADFDENYVFNEVLNKLIDKEVEKRVAEKVENYDLALKRKVKAEEDLYSKNQELYKLQLKLKDAEKIFTKQGADEARRSFLGGHKLGDEVYFASRKAEHHDCPTCKGKTKVTAIFQGVEITAQCPDCVYGRNYTYTYEIKKGKICEIKIHTWADGKQLNTTFYVNLSPRGYDSKEFSDANRLHVNETDAIKDMEEMIKKDQEEELVKQQKKKDKR